MHSQNFRRNIKYHCKHMRGRIAASSVFLKEKKKNYENLHKYIFYFYCSQLKKKDSVTRQFFFFT